MKKLSKRLLALVMAMLLLVGSVPLSVAAYDGKEAINDTYRLQQRQMAVDTLLRGVQGNSALSDVEKALILHDRLAYWVKYSFLGNPDCYTIDGIFINRQAVCQGYAEAYKLLLDKVGVYNFVVTSKAINHAWNILRIDGQYYHVDVTWDDPGEEVTGLGQVYHENFLVSDAQLRATKTDVNNGAHSGHVAYDFVRYDTGKKIGDICKSTKYDGAMYWKRSTSAFQLIDDKLYYVDHGDQVIKRIDGATHTPLVSVAAKWYTGGANGQYWLRNYTALDSYGNRLYYSQPQGIYYYDVTTGESSGYHFPTTNVNTGYCLYEFMIDNGVMVTGVKKNLKANLFDSDCDMMRARMPEYTGLYEENGYWYRIGSNGYRDKTLNGLYQHYDKWYALTEGIVNYDYTGFVEYKGSKYYVQKGMVKSDYTGVVTVGSKAYYVKKGKLNTATTGLYKGGSTWYLIKKGVCNTAYTGLYKWSGTWYYVQKGKVNFGYSGLWKHNGTWYAVQKGKVKFGYTGLIKYDGTWYLMQKGKLNKSYTGLYKYNGTWYYLQKGTVNFKYTGLIKKDGVWYGVVKGRINFDYTGLIKHKGTWYVVKKGKVDFKHTGSIKHNGTNYYAKKGVVSLKTTGFVTISGKKYFVKNSKISNHTGIYVYGKTWYYLYKGYLRNDGNYVDKYKGKRYFIRNGKVDFSFSGKVRLWNSNGTYTMVTVKKGVVQ